MSLQAIHHQCF